MRCQGSWWRNHACGRLPWVPEVTSFTHDPSDLLVWLVFVFAFQADLLSHWSILATQGLEPRHKGSSALAYRIPMKETKTSGVTLGSLRVLALLDCFKILAFRDGYIYVGSCPNCLFCELAKRRPLQRSQIPCFVPGGPISGWARRWLANVLHRRRWKTKSSHREQHRK